MKYVRQTGEFPEHRDIICCAHLLAAIHSAQANAQFVPAAPTMSCVLSGTGWAVTGTGMLFHPAVCTCGCLSPAVHRCLTGVSPSLLGLGLRLGEGIRLRAEYPEDTEPLQTQKSKAKSFSYSRNLFLSFSPFSPPSFLLFSVSWSFISVFVPLE